MLRAAGLLLTALLPLGAQAQTYLLNNNTPVTTCAGTLYDSGGASGNYLDNESYTKTFSPAIAGNVVRLTFTVFDIENNFDYVYLYNGADTNAPLIGRYTGTTLPPVATATNATGQLTVRFTSDYGVTTAGFAAVVSCIDPATLPVITSFTPSSGTMGTSVVISGINFTPATSVQFNGVTASFTVNSDTQITAIVPAGVTVGPIRVVTSVGTAESTSNFTYPPPTITSFTPTSGDAGTSVVITGTNFNAVTNVNFTGAAASSYTVNSDTQITATVPPLAAVGPISVVTGFGTATSASSFTITNPGYLISDPTPVTTCSAMLYDSGGPDGDYGIYENYTRTFLQPRLATCCVLRSRNSS